jgi:hypothetical protein
LNSNTTSSACNLTHCSPSTPCTPSSKQPDA